MSGSRSVSGCRTDAQTSSRSRRRVWRNISPQRTSAKSASRVSTSVASVRIWRRCRGFWRKVRHRTIMWRTQGRRSRSRSFRGTRSGSATPATVFRGWNRRIGKRSGAGTIASAARPRRGGGPGSGHAAAAKNGGGRTLYFRTVEADERNRHRPLGKEPNHAFHHIACRNRGAIGRRGQNHRLFQGSLCREYALAGPVQRGDGSRAGPWRRRGILRCSATWFPGAGKLAGRQPLAKSGWLLLPYCARRCGQAR